MYYFGMLTTDTAEFTTIGRQIDFRKDITHWVFASDNILALAGR
jgi:hypothetical protein